MNGKGFAQGQLTSNFFDQVECLWTKWQMTFDGLMRW